MSEKELRLLSLSKTKEKDPAKQESRMRELETLISDPNIEINHQDARGQTALLNACACNDVPLVARLLKHPAISVNICNADQISPLYLAVHENLIEVAKLLLAHPDIQPDMKKLHKAAPFYVVCEKGHLELVKLMLANPRIDVNQTFFHTPPLIASCIDGHVEVVKLLLADPRVDVVQKNRNGSTAFFVACLNGHLDVIKLLLQDKRFNPNHRGRTGATAFFAACQMGHSEAVRFLLQIEKIDINLPNNENVTPIFVALQNGRLRVVKLILASPRYVDTSIRPKIDDTHVEKAQQTQRKKAFQLIESYQQDPDKVREQLRASDPAKGTAMPSLDIKRHSLGEASASKRIKTETPSKKSVDSGFNINENENEHEHELGEEENGLNNDIHHFNNDEIEVAAGEMLRNLETISEPAKPKKKASKSKKSSILPSLLPPLPTNINNNNTNAGSASSSKRWQGNLRGYSEVPEEGERDEFILDRGSEEPGIIPQFQKQIELLMSQLQHKNHIIQEQESKVLILNTQLLVKSTEVQEQSLQIQALRNHVQQFEAQQNSRENQNKNMIKQLEQNVAHIEELAAKNKEQALRLTLLEEELKMKESDKFQGSHSFIFREDQIMLATNFLDPKRKVSNHQNADLYQGSLPVAIAKLKTDFLGDSSLTLLKKVEVLSRVSHDYLISLVGHSDFSVMNPSLIQPLTSKGTLHEFLDSNREKPGENENGQVFFVTDVLKLKFAYQIGSVLQYLHQLNMQDPDLNGNPLNLLISSFDVLVDSNLDVAINSLSLIDPLNHNHLIGTIVPEYEVVYTFGLLITDMFQIGITKGEILPNMFSSEILPTTDPTEKQSMEIDNNHSNHIKHEEGQQQQQEEEEEEREESKVKRKENEESLEKEETSITTTTAAAAANNQAEGEQERKSGNGSGLKEKIAHLAMECVNEDQHKRPSLSQIVTTLEALRSLYSES